MYILNITMNMENDVHEKCLEWLKPNIQKLLIDNGLISNFKVLKIMDEELHGGSTFTMQFQLPDMESISPFEEKYDLNIANYLYQNYKGQFVEFRTILKQVDWEM